MNADEFAKKLDTSKWDQWFSKPEFKAWEAAHEVNSRRTFAALRPVGDPVDPNRSRSGDPQFDAMMKKAKGEQ